MAAAVQEDVDVLGVSILSGAHMTLLPRILDLLRSSDAADVLVVAGGVIPDEDLPALRDPGVAEVFLQETPPASSVARVRELVETPGRLTLAGARLFGHAAIVSHERPRSRRDPARPRRRPRRLAAAIRPRATGPRPTPSTGCPRSNARRPRRATASSSRSSASRSRYAWERSPFYRRKWEAAGVSPDTLRTLADLGSLPRRDQGGAPRRAGRAPALRRLPLHRPGSRRAHPRNQRDDGPADRVRHRPRRTGSGSARRTPGSCGRSGIRPGDRVLDLLLLQPLHGLLGRARRRRAPGRDDVPLRRRRPGPDAGGRAVGARDPARRVLRDALLRAPLRRDGPPRGRRPARASGSGSCSSRASPAPASRPRSGSSRTPSAASASTRAAWRR